MLDIKDIADNANVIVNGYAFTKDAENVKVLNLHNLTKAAYLRADGEILETTMDDIELEIMLDYYLKNRKYMEV